QEAPYTHGCRCPKRHDSMTALNVFTSSSRLALHTLTHSRFAIKLAFDIKRDIEIQFSQSTTSVRLVVAVVVVVGGKSADRMCHIKIIRYCRLSILVQLFRSTSLDDSDDYLTAPSSISYRYGLHFAFGNSDALSRK